MSQGQSIVTIDKERCLASALAIGMKIAEATLGKWNYPYWHFDANAGSGWNEQVGVDGSPVVFHLIADTYLRRMRRHAFFCDHNVDVMKQLSTRLAKWSSTSHLLPRDNEEGLELFMECIRQGEKRPEYATGSVILDPNGYYYRNAQGEGVPIRSLTKLATEYRRIDIILNLNTWVYKLQRANGQNVLEPRAVLASLKKRHWLVRMTQAGGHQFLLAVGRNVETGDHTRLGFHQLDSDAGRHIMTLAEGKRQGVLFDDPPVQQL